MMRSLARLAQARKSAAPARIVIPHAYDRRILRAAAQAATKATWRWCSSLESRIMELAQKHGLPRFDSKVEIVNPFRHDHVENSLRSFSPCVIAKASRDDGA